MSSSRLPTDTTAQFPGHAHRRLLRQRCAILDSKGKKTGIDVERLSEPERWMWFAYDYAFHRVANGTLDDMCPTDPEKQWFDADLVRRAEAQLAEELGMQAPSAAAARSRARRLPSAEELAYVEERMGEVRTNLAQFLDNSKNMYRSQPSTPAMEPSEIATRGEWQAVCRKYFASCQDRWNGVPRLEFRERLSEDADLRGRFARKYGSMCAIECDRFVDEKTRSQLSWNQR
jgi:hypothetical protein